MKSQISTTHLSETQILEEISKRPFIEPVTQTDSLTIFRDETKDGLQILIQSSAEGDNAILTIK